MKILAVAAATLAISLSASAAAITIPGALVGVSVPSNPAGFSFVSGPLLPTDTITFTQVSGLANNPCLENATSPPLVAPGYCTNGAGVVTVAGVPGQGVGTAATGVPTHFTYGALLMTISGFGTVQVFATDAGHGLGSATPATGFTLPVTTLAALGFGSLAGTNAGTTITFTVGDTNYADNSGAFLLTQDAGAVPEPMSMLLFGSGLLAVSLIGRKKLLGK